MRVDASEQIGTGHFMRCLALAEALGRRGAKCQFLSRGLPETLRALAVRGAHEVSSLGVRDVPLAASGLAHADWLGTSQQRDAEQTVAAIGGRKTRWLVVDHYAIDARWHAVARRHADRILVIDDLADRPHECDVLLDQNLHDDMRSRYASRVPTHCRLLLGPQYALLRPEFRAQRASQRPRNGNIRRVLVLMGGVDRARLTLMAIEALAPLSRSLEIDVVISAQHSARDEVTEACQRQGFALHVQPANLPELMQAADISVGAAGSTTWERCCMGLPTLCVTEAANQVPIAKALHGAGAAINLGDKARVRAPDLTAALVSLIQQPGRVAAMASAAGKLVDGAGTDRVGDILLRHA